MKDKERKKRKLEGMISKEEFKDGTTSFEEGH